MDKQTIKLNALSYASRYVKDVEELLKEAKKIEEYLKKDE